jgi:hypothetical protein
MLGVVTVGEALAPFTTSGANSWAGCIRGPFYPCCDDAGVCPMGTQIRPLTQGAAEGEGVCHSVPNRYLDLRRKIQISPN